MSCAGMGADLPGRADWQGGAGGWAWPGAQAPCTLTINASWESPFAPLRVARLRLLPVYGSFRIAVCMGSGARLIR